MLTSYLTQPMREYERMIETEILKNKPKHSRAIGVRRPDTRRIVALAVGLFMVLVIWGEVLTI